MLSLRREGEWGRKKVIHQAYSPRDRELGETMENTLGVPIGQRGMRKEMGNPFYFLRK